MRIWAVIPQREWRTCAVSSCSVPAGGIALSDPGPLFKGELPIYISYLFDFVYVLSVYKLPVPQCSSSAPPWVAVNVTNSRGTFPFSSQTWRQGNACVVHLQSVLSVIPSTRQKAHSPTDWFFAADIDIKVWPPPHFLTCRWYLSWLLCFSAYGKWVIPINIHSFHILGREQPHECITTESEQKQCVMQTSDGIWCMIGNLLATEKLFSG